MISLLGNMVDKDFRINEVRQRQDMCYEPDNGVLLLDSSVSLNTE